MAAVKSQCKGKILVLIQEEKRSILLLSSYWLFLLILSFWFPYLESSNGSPYSLIFFTATFILIYIVPTLVGVLILPLSIFLRWEGGMIYGKKTKSDIRAIFSVTWKQKITICILAGIVLLLFVVDGDVTCVIRYTMNGKPCWPVLIPQLTRSHLPYPLQHAWIKSWHKFFIGYSPGITQVFIQKFGRDLGEVRKLLPVLIGVYVVSLLTLPSKFTLLRRTLFSCVAGVVLGGLSSAFLKILLHRYRPNAYGDPYKWSGPGTAVVNHMAFSKLDLSFPAGHTTITSAVATCLYVGFLQSVKASTSVVWKVCIALLLFSFPIAVLVSRVGDCYHWTSDATFGVCSFHICIIIGLIRFSLSYFSLSDPLTLP